MAAAVEFAKSPAEVLRVGSGFSLAGVDPESTPGYTGGKTDGKALLAAQDARLAELQEKLFAEGRSGSGKRLLLILQAMDTAGKGGIVSHVVGAMDPQGVQVSRPSRPQLTKKSRTTSCGGSRSKSLLPEWWESLTVHSTRMS